MHEAAEHVSSRARRKRRTGGGGAAVPLPPVARAGRQATSRSAARAGTAQQGGRRCSRCMARCEGSSSRV